MVVGGKWHIEILGMSGAGFSCKQPIRPSEESCLETPNNNVAPPTMRSDVFTIAVDFNLFTT